MKDKATSEVRMMNSAKALAINSCIFAIILLLVVSGSAAFAAHTSTVDLQPEWSKANQQITYTTSICKTSGDSVNEVRIYKDYDGSIYYSNFTCSEKPGWELLYIGSYPACFYVATSSSPQYDPINVDGECQNFTFSAHTPVADENNCDLTWKFETRDVQNNWQYLYDTTSVDDLPPVIVKVIGTPNYTYDGTTYYITRDTPITLSAYDEGDCRTSGIKSCQYRYMVNQSGIWTTWVDWNPEGFTFYFPEDSNHTLEAICTDYAGNYGMKGSLTEIDIVETVPPVTTKYFNGPQFPDDGDLLGTTHWITSQTNIELSATDPQPHPVGLNSTYYRVNLVDDKNCYEQENCAEIAPTRCEEGTETATIFSDDFETGLNKWVLQNTSADIGLGYTDPSPAGGNYVVLRNNSNITASIDTTGLNNIELSYYRKTKEIESNDRLRAYWRVGNSGAWTQLEAVINTTWSKKTWSLPGAENQPLIQIRFFLDDGSGDYGFVDDVIVTGEQTITCDEGWVTYDGQFNIPEQSCHRIEYYSNDLLGNTENMNTQCVFVDNTAPVVEKSVGEPKVNGEYMDAHWVINSSTQITLTCTDGQPHPVDHNTITYRYKVNDGEFGTWTTYTGPFTFPEESRHTLEYKCRDALGNTGETQTEVDIVDNTPPAIDMTIGEPQIGDCPADDENDKCYIRDHVTPVTFEVTDTGAHLTGLDKCDWSYTVDGEQGRSGTEREFPFEIIFPEDSNHVLTVTCYDAIGNSRKVTEKFVVDSIPPITEKRYGKPFVSSDDLDGSTDGDIYHWITTSTPINLTAADQDPHPVGMGTIYWRTTLLEISDENCVARCEEYSGVGAWNNASGEKATFTIPEQSCHLIEFYSVDQLGNDESRAYFDANVQCGEINSADINSQCYRRVNRQCVFVDDTAPVTTKVIGEPKVVKGNGGNGEQVVLTFEDLGYQGTLPKNYGGINWTTDWGYYNWPQESYTPHSGIVKVYNNNEEHPTIEFPELATFEGAWFAGQTYRSIRFMGYNNDVLVGMSDEIALNATPQWLAANFGGAVNKVVLNLSGTSLGMPWNYFIMDDFTFKMGEAGETYITQQTPITLTCNDQEPHPVNNITLKYRYAINSGEWTDWIIGTSGQSFTFPQDSNHTLEYYCVDGLGNTEQTQSEVDIVDTVAPVITKTILGPQYGDCPPQNHANDELYENTCISENENECLPPEGDRCYVDGATTIHVEAVDPAPHPVEGVTCDWSYTIRGHVIEYTNGGQGVLAPFDITFPEESIHDLRIVCQDALGNTARDYETFIVDHTPPVTTKALVGPQYPENAEEADYPRWINSKTNVTFSAYDPYPHPSGVNAIYTQVTIVADEYCRDQNLCENYDQEEYDVESFHRRNTLDTYLNIPEESCHMIEYYSVDNVEKTEPVRRQCIFVDNTPPTPIKTVGKPGDKIYADGYHWNYYPEVNGRCWNGQNNSIDCWKVTTMTPITMECNDTGNHPVDHSTISFKVDFDNGDATEKYCDALDGTIGEDGYCNLQREDPVELLFKEESEHNLKFYCTDALGNQGPVDDEKFKVEGSSFEITINKKWNLISVPFVLLNDSMHKVFDNQSDKIMSVWTYDAVTNQWYIYTPDGIDNDNMNSMMPGNGYWVLASNDTTLLIGGSLFSPAKTPPTKTIVKGWNLIGYWGTDNKFGNGTVMSYTGPNGNGKTAYCELYSLGDTLDDKEFNSLWSYWEPYNPNSWIQYNKYKYMDPGAGYWLHTNQEGEYVVSTDCSASY